MGRARYTLGMVAILLLCLLVALLALIWMAAGIVTRSPRAWRLAVSFDQLGNVVGGGDEDETISARCWRYRTEQPYKALRAAIDGCAALAGEANHCESAYVTEMIKAQARLAMEEYF